MHPPQHILDKLQKIHPWIRLGWKGVDKKGPSDELNKGAFYLIQLVKNELVEWEFNEPWGDKGPIYGKKYDRSRRVPYQMAGPFHPAEVDDDAFPEALRGMMKSMKEKVIASAVKRGIEYDDAVKDLSGEIGEYLYWLAQKAEADRPPVVAQKHLTDKEKAVLKGEVMKDLKQSFMPVGM